MELQFRLLADAYRFVKFNSALSAELASSTKAFTVNVAGDYSIMLPAADIDQIQLGPNCEISEINWVCLSLLGEFAFSTIGVAAEVTRIFAEASVSVLVVSGFRTDHFFIAADDLNNAVNGITRAGHEISNSIET
jgi:hypothetical protein